MFDEFKEIVGDETALHPDKWSTKWRAIEGMRDYFDKITEELVDPTALESSLDPSSPRLGAPIAAMRPGSSSGTGSTSLTSSRSSTSSSPTRRSVRASPDASSTCSSTSTRTRTMCRSSSS